MIETSPGQITQVWFAAQGPKLAVYHHGVPKPRTLTEQELAAFASASYSVACPVRRGYLASTFTAPGSMASDAPITAEVVRQLGFETFVSFGFSGGGPRALADAALTPACLGAATFGTVAPTNREFDALAVMPEEDRGFVAGLRAEGMNLLPMFEGWAESNPAFQVGTEGWLADEISMVTDWGFEASSVSKPTVLFTGDADANVSPECSRWLHTQTVGSILEVLPGIDHDNVFTPETITKALSLLG